MKRTIAILLAILMIAMIFVGCSSKTKFTVTFDTNGGNAIDNIEAESGTAIELPVPEKDGFVFAGWVDANDPSDNLNFATSPYTVEADVTLLAVWNEFTGNTFTITFDSNGGTPVEPLVCNEGEQLKLPANPTKEGMEFLCWKDINEVPISDGALLAAEDITLYAYWTEKTESSSSSSEKKNAKIEANSIKFKSDSVSLARNKSKELEVTFDPQKTTETKLKWSSSNEKVVTVNDGIIKGVSKGEATITAETSNGKKATCTVTVGVPVESIKISADREVISYYGVNNAVINAEISPSDADVTSVIWNCPGSTGQNAYFSNSINGNKITLSARNNSSSVAQEVGVYALVKAEDNYGIEVKSQSITVTSEPQIYVTIGSEDTCEGATRAEGKIVINYNGPSIVIDLKLNVQIGSGVGIYLPGLEGNKVVDSDYIKAYFDCKKDYTGDTYASFQFTSKGGQKYSIRCNVQNG